MLPKYRLPRAMANVPRAPSAIATAEVLWVFDFPKLLLTAYAPLFLTSLTLGFQLFSVRAQPHAPATKLPRKS